MSTPTDPPAPTQRATAWWRLLIVVLVAAIFAASWVSYARLFANAAVRYDAVADGASQIEDGADYRVLGFRQALQLRDDTKGTVSAAANTVWVIAEVEVVLREAKDEFYCNRFDLIGAQGRRYEAESVPAYRPDRETPCGPGDTTLGRPFRYELIYVVPTRDAAELYGLVNYGFGSGKTQLVLRPPA